MSKITKWSNCLEVGMVLGWVADLPVRRVSAGGVVQGQHSRREPACLRGMAAGPPGTAAAHGERTPAGEPPRGSAVLEAGGNCAEQNQPSQDLQEYIDANVTSDATSMRNDAIDSHSDAMQLQHSHAARFAEYNTEGHCGCLHACRHTQSSLHLTQ